MNLFTKMPIRVAVFCICLFTSLSVLAGVEEKNCGLVLKTANESYRFTDVDDIICRLYLSELSAPFQILDEDSGVVFSPADSNPELTIGESMAFKTEKGNPVLVTNSVRNIGMVFNRNTKTLTVDHFLKPDTDYVNVWYKDEHGLAVGSVVSKGTRFQFYPSLIGMDSDKSDGLILLEAETGDVLPILYTEDGSEAFTPILERDVVICSSENLIGEEDHLTFSNNKNYVSELNVVTAENSYVIEGIPNGKIMVCIEDYDQEGANLYSKIKNDDIVIKSFEWEDTGNASYMLKSKTDAILSFSKSGEYKLSYSLRWSEKNSSDTYSYQAEWRIIIKEQKPTSLFVIPEMDSFEEGTAILCDANLIGGKDAVISWSCYGESISIEPMGSQCKIYGLTPGIGRVDAITDNGLSDSAMVKVEASAITQGLKDGLFLAGSDTNWKIKDNYRFTKVKPDTYELYLTHLDGDFLLSNKNKTLRLGKGENPYDPRLVVDGSNIPVESPLKNVRLSYCRSTDRLNIENYADPSIAYHTLSLTMNNDSGIAIPVADGAVYIFRTEDNTSDCDSENHTLGLYDASSRERQPLMFTEDSCYCLTPPIHNDMRVSYSCEKLNNIEAVEDSTELPIAFRTVSDGVILLGLPDNVIIDIFTPTGILLERIKTDGTEEQHITLPTSGCYLLHLSTGQTLKYIKNIS